MKETSASESKVAGTSGMVYKVELLRAHSLGCMCANTYTQGGAGEQEVAKDRGREERIKMAKRKNKNKTQKTYVLATYRPADTSPFPVAAFVFSLSASEMMGNA